MTQKSESVREAEQRELEALHWWLKWWGPKLAELRVHTPQRTSLPGPDEIAEGLVQFAKSVTLKLAEELEQMTEPHEPLGPIVTKMLRSEFAAWLREKAR